MLLFGLMILVEIYEAQNKNDLIRIDLGISRNMFKSYVSVCGACRRWSILKQLVLSVVQSVGHSAGVCFMCCCRVSFEHKHACS